ncbi:MAG: hypothetical protein R3D45_01370 [Rhizobiaceae bacterium]
MGKFLFARPRPLRGRWTSHQFGKINRPYNRKRPAPQWRLCIVMARTSSHAAGALGAGEKLKGFPEMKRLFHAVNAIRATAADHLCRAILALRPRMGDPARTWLAAGEEFIHE